MMTENSVWAVVMNSEHARILCGITPRPSAGVPEITLSTQHPRLQDIMSDSPGRSFSSADSRRSGMEYASDPVRDAHRRFVRSVADRLDDELRGGKFGKLAVFASKPVLGLLRQEMTPALSHAVVSETDKNLVNEPLSDLLETVTETVFPPLPD